MIDEFTFSRIRGRGLPIFEMVNGRLRRRQVFKDLKSSLIKNIVEHMYCYECKCYSKNFFLHEFELGHGVYRYRIYCDICNDGIFQLLFD